MRTKRTSNRHPFLFQFPQLCYAWLCFFVYGTAVTYARESPYTLQGAGPKYWIAYEYCWTNNKPLTESRWKDNIDWVNEQFKTSGYNLVCTDGWIENAQTINANGYITKYNDSWINGFDYWAKYLANQNMQLGVYYNPMWLTRTALKENIQVLGTNFHAKDITGDTPFNIDLNWVDTDKPGAKEWIQGYVRYFIDLGATYLRIDFLENYEKNYGTRRYAQALEWIKEAAENKIFLSLVMPNCYNHGQTELIYGDMIRIDDDCFNGGWDFLSSRKRGQAKPDWPQYGNAFDGFVSFSDISGRGQMILDGDFIRLNKLNTDAERIFQISLFTMAGSPICIADQYDTADSCIWFYKNKEILRLNEQGFIGKPLSNNINDTTNSSRWVGQTPNGDWIIGLFNREETPQIRSIDFIKELGIKKGSILNIKDLWTQTAFNINTDIFSEKLQPHSCKILRVNCNDQKYETEVASMLGDVRKQTNCFGYNGSGYSGPLLTTGAKVLIAVDVPSDGEYILKLRCIQTPHKNGSISFYVNNQKVNRLTLRKGTATWQLFSEKVDFKQGSNLITVQCDPEDSGIEGLDYIQILPNTQTDPTKK